MSDTVDQADALRYAARAISDQMIASRKPRGSHKVDQIELAVGMMRNYLRDDCPNPLQEDQLCPLSMLVGRALQAGAALTIQRDAEYSPES